LSAGRVPAGGASSLIANEAQRPAAVNKYITILYLCGFGRHTETHMRLRIRANRPTSTRADDRGGFVAEQAEVAKN
jgi:hypothetical protein